MSTNQQYTDDQLVEVSIDLCVSVDEIKEVLRPKEEGQSTKEPDSEWKNKFERASLVCEYCELYKQSWLNRRAQEIIVRKLISERHTR